MTIQFTRRDMRVVRSALMGAGLQASPRSIRTLTGMVQAAFRQQLEYEADFLAESLAIGELPPYGLPSIADVETA